MFRFIIDITILSLILFLSWNVFDLNQKIRDLNKTQGVDLSSWFLQDKIINNELKEVQNQTESARAFIAYFKEQSCADCKFNSIFFDVVFIHAVDPAEDIVSQRQNIPLKAMPNFDILVRNRCTSGVIGSPGGNRIWQDLPERTVVNCPITNRNNKVVGFYGVSFNKVINENQIINKIRILKLNDDRIKDILFQSD